MSDESIEQEIQSKGLAAPRITPADIEANIASEHYFTADAGVIASSPKSMSDEELNAIPASLSQVTFCILVLHNGTKIVGINYGAIDPAQHSAERGRADARAQAVEQIWPLMGYELRSKLAKGG